MDVRKLACAGAAALAGALIVSVATASLHAQSFTGPVTVTAHVTDTRFVPYGDLSLTTDAGRKTLVHRVRAAVKELCPAYDATFNAYDAAMCQNLAWAGARPQIDNAVAAAIVGQPLTMSIEITAAPR